MGPAPTTGGQTGWSIGHEVHLAESREGNLTRGALLWRGGGLECPMSRRSPRPRVKRIYELSEALDSTRVLVDLVWRRGLAKEHASVEVWLKEFAPSAGLRTGFGQVPCTRTSHMSIGKRTVSGRMRAVSRRHEHDLL